MGRTRCKLDNHPRSLVLLHRRFLYPSPRARPCAAWKLDVRRLSTHALWAIMSGDSRQASIWSRTVSIFLIPHADRGWAYIIGEICLTLYALHAFFIASQSINKAGFFFERFLFIQLWVASRVLIFGGFFFCHYYSIIELMSISRGETLDWFFSSVLIKSFYDNFDVSLIELHCTGHSLMLLTLLSECFQNLRRGRGPYLRPYSNLRAHSR